MALTLEEVMAEIDRIKEEYAQEDPDNTAQAISTYMQENEVPEDLFRTAMAGVNSANYRSIAQSGLAGGKSLGGDGDGTGVVKLTPIRSGQGQEYALPDQYTLADVQVAGRPMMNEAQLSQYLPYDPYSIEQRRAYEVDAPRAVTFYDRMLNRPVPVVTKGFLPSGEPTTGITMGDAALAPSGEMDITSVFPSTGMNIEGSGLGGTTVGLSAEQAAAAGLPPGSATGNILSTTGDNFVTPAGTLTTDQVLGTTGTGNFVFDTVTGGTGNDTVTDDTVVDNQSPAEKYLQDLYLNSPSTEIASQRIADYANSIGGLTSQQVVNAINPVISQGGAGLLDTGSALTTADVDAAVAAGNLPLAGTGAPVTTNLADLYTQDAATGQGDYTTLESAYRVLDEGSRQGLTLDQIGEAFNLGEGQAAKVLADVGIDASTYEPGGVSNVTAAAPSNVYATGIGSLQAGQSAVPTIQQNLAAMYDPSQKGTAAEAQTAQQILAQGAAAGLNLDQIGASFNLTPEQTRQELIRAGLDTSVIPGFQKGGAVDTGDQGGGFVEGLRSVGRGISGLARYAKDKMFGEVPEYMADTSEIRFSGRPGSTYREEYYGEGPTFEERLIKEYGYPESPERPGSADFSRESRPTDRMDMPATSEILDARAHALGTALYGNEYGGEASTAMGVMGEEYDRTMDNASREDIAMDTRNNAVGRKILRNAGIMNTTRDLTRMVDQKILDQLDRIMDRPIKERRAESPKEGPDLYFSRLDPKTLKTTTDPSGIVNATNYSRHPGGI